MKLIYYFAYLKIFNIRELPIAQVVPPDVAVLQPPPADTRAWIATLVERHVPVMI
jgi:hypothetical protein